MVHQSQFDKWLMRGKDIGIIIGIIIPCFLFMFKYYSLPGEVQAQAEQIKEVRSTVVELHEVDLKLSSRLDNIELKQDYTNKGVDRIEGWLKNLSNRVNSTR